MAATCNYATSSPRVAIIGAGIGGAACAYYLMKEVPGANVTVIEAQDRIGGRIKNIAFFGRTVNVGAAVFNAEQRVIAELTKELSLTVERFPSCGGFPNNFVWDGKDIIQTGRLMKREQAADTKLQQTLQDFLAALDTNYQKHNQGTFDSVQGFLKAGGLEVYSGQSVDDFFRDTAVNEVVKKYAVEPVIREYFGQGLEGSSLLGMMCLAGVYQDAFKTEGGMSQLVKALIASSRCNLHLNSRVTLVTKTDTGEFEVTCTQTASDMKVAADVVVIAAPFEWTGIQFDGFKPNPSTTQPTRQWERLYYYVCYVAAQSIRASYFKKDPTSWIDPQPLYTTSNTTQPWVVIRQKGSSQGYNIYCVFSSVDITKDDLMIDLFDGVQDYTSNQWDYVYPLNPPIRDGGEYQSIILDDNMYSLNGLESVATQMEISVIAGRNVAKLIAKDV